LLFKLLFYKILVKIYYQLFRWRKSGIIKNSPLELLWKQPVYFFIFTFVLIFFLANTSNTDRTGAMETKIQKTVMANLVQTEFSTTPEEELIEETATPNSLTTVGLDKYADNSCVLNKQTTDTAGNDLVANDLVFNDDNDLVFKPQIIASNNNPADSNLATPVRNKIIYYTVQNGDTISTISRRFGVTVNTILWSNNLTSLSLIRPGDSLEILPYSGVAYTVKRGDTLAQIAQNYGIDLDKILSCNNLGKSLAVGQKIIIPGAQKIATAPASTPAKSNYTGISVIKDLIKSPTVKASGNSMTWPTVGHRITQYFSWSHPGVDIANKIGTPVYAADSGVVIISQGGYNGGYGNTIVIDHGGGKKTRYGHSSKLLVKVGDRVEKGQLIMLMGSTGRSTGPHLHFEIIINGTKYNPLSYVR
jgi:murein DD-endopeptidase MepM/ murein hydrolase activator NlpD